MPTVFREPPLLSRMTLMSAWLAGVRATGQSRRALGLMLRRVHSPARKAKLYAGFEPRPTDLFVATYPKSGTNWALQLALQTAWRGAAEFGHVHEAAPWPEAPFPGIVGLADEGWRAAPHPTRVIKSAIELRYLPVDSPARFLAVLRDPKDVTVSAWHFITGVFGMTSQISLDEWVEWSLSPQFPIAHWADHAADLWAARERENVEVLLFAEMKRDLPAALARVEKLMGVELEPEEREKVLERCSFRWMKAHEDQFGPPRMRFMATELPKMMRKGAVGGASESLSPDQLRRIDDFQRTRLEELGSDLPYDALFPGKVM